MNLYFIAIVLPQQLNDRILKYKLLMQERFGCTVGLKSPAHITLIPPCWLDENMEAALLNDTNELARLVLPFTIATHNFSVFKPRTIFIDLQPNDDLHNLKNTTDGFFAVKEKYKLKIDKRPFHPHITIATRDLHKKTFYEAWSLFENKTFNETWQAHNISLLRHSKRVWEVIGTAPFKSE